LKPKLLAAVIVGAPLLFFGLTGLRAVQLAREGEVPDEFRDLDCDGKVGYAEWLRGGIDFRLRSSTLVPGCQDVYLVKSEQVIVVRCETPPRCRLAKNLRR
jgi:hypothetical protein